MMLHFPEGEKKNKKLCLRAADVHAKAAACYLNSLTCRSEQKKAIVQAVLKEKKKSRPGGDSAE